jgi:hypothetical protein
MGYGVYLASGSVPGVGFYSSFFYDVKLMPTIKRYKKYEIVYKWW